jgi:hypothetical protein
LHIEPIKEGKKAYIDAPSLQLLDELHEHIQGGGTTNEFLKQKASKSTGQSRTDDRTQQEGVKVARILLAKVIFAYFNHNTNT